MTNKTIHQTWLDPDAPPFDPRIAEKQMHRNAIRGSQMLREALLRLVDRRAA